VCVDTCPTGAISLDEKEGVATIDQTLCTECLACLDVCPNGAVQRAESPELVPASESEIVEGQVIESQVRPVTASSPLVATRQAGRLATLAGAALTLVGNWLLPRAADALVGTIERRLTRGTNSVPSANPPRSGSRSLSKQMGNRGGGQGRQRRRRRRGK
jgi:ferredoxin